MFPTDSFLAARNSVTACCLGCASLTDSTLPYSSSGAIRNLFNFIHKCQELQISYSYLCYYEKKKMRHYFLGKLCINVSADHAASVFGLHWREQIPQKHWNPSHKLHDITCQKTTSFDIQCYQDTQISHSTSHFHVIQFFYQLLKQEQVLQFCLTSLPIIVHTRLFARLRSLTRSADCWWRNSEFLPTFSNVVTSSCRRSFNLASRRRASASSVSLSSPSHPRPWNNRTLYLKLTDIDDILIGHSIAKNHVAKFRKCKIPQRQRAVSSHAFKYATEICSRYL